MSDEVDQWMRKHWMSWLDRGISIACRPNLLHGGYVMPHINTLQAEHFFQFTYENGSEGYDISRIFGHRATTGPMLYIYMRLGWAPEVEIEQIRGEYFSAFGPATSDVERNFDYWEEYSRIRPGGDLYNPVNAHVAFPKEVFPPAEDILNKAINGFVIRFYKPGFHLCIKLIQIYQIINNMVKIVYKNENLLVAI